MLAWFRGIFRRHTWFAIRQEEPPCTLLTDGLALSVIIIERR